MRTYLVGRIEGDEFRGRVVEADSKLDAAKTEWRQGFIGRDSQVVSVVRLAGGSKTFRLISEHETEQTPEMHQTTTRLRVEAA